MSSIVDANESEASGSPQNNRLLFMKLFTLWLGTNVLLWFAPGLWKAGKQSLFDWRRERDADHYETRVFDDGDSSSPRLPYLFFRPDHPANRKAPLVLILHGSGERGEDCRAQLATVGTFLVEAAVQVSQPCFVVAPQCPVKLNWQSEGGLDVTKAVDELLNELINTETIDASRVYLIGYSMGAYGCWHYGASMPDRFAGCIAVAGGGDPDSAARIVGTPFWAIHGENDTVVDPKQSQQMVDAVNEAGGDARLTILEGVGHNSFQVVRQTPNAYLEWLFEQQRFMEPSSD